MNLLWPIALHSSRLTQPLMSRTGVLKSLPHPLTGGSMKSKSIFSVIAAVLVSLVAGCASFSGAPDDLFVESKTYNGGE
jgi:hypothetical protein